MNAPVDPALLRTDRSSAPALALEQASPPAPQIDAAAALRIQAAVLGYAGFRDAASALAGELAALFGAVRAGLGMLEKDSVCIEAISGTVEFRRDSELCRGLAAAMQESLEQGGSIAYPSPADARPRVTLAHAEAARHGPGRIVSVPLISAGRPIGALTLEHCPGAPPATAMIGACEHLACLIAPVLELKRDADRPWHARLLRAVRELRARIFGPGHTTLKAGSIFALACAAALCFWPVEYRVSAPARLEGAIQRVLVAPADGFLREVHVKPGDSVVAEQVLAELADQDLELERRRWSSELAQHENSFRSALAKGDRTQYVVNAGKAEAARAQLELVQQLIGRSRIRAPFDGVVIQGDLSQRLGAPVQRGEGLLTVAPANSFRLIAEVDERDVRDVIEGRDGALALAALPEADFGFRVARVTPVATAKDGRNYYEVEGRLEAAPEGLRPGLQGVAKIAAGERPLAWIWAHRFLDWARLALWSLGG